MTKQVQTSKVGTSRSPQTRRNGLRLSATFPWMRMAMAQPRKVATTISSPAALLASALPKRNEAVRAGRRVGDGGEARGPLALERLDRVEHQQQARSSERVFMRPRGGEARGEQQLGLERSQGDQAGAQGLEQDQRTEEVEARRGKEVAQLRAGHLEDAREEADAPARIPRSARVRGKGTTALLPWIPRLAYLRARRAPAEAATTGRRRRTTSRPGGGPPGAAGRARPPAGPGPGRPAGRARTARRGRCGPCCRTPPRGRA